MSEYMLPPGEMAVIVTVEEADIPAEYAAEVSPPNYLLNDGLLVLAASHVDPGYRGPLTARVVNFLDKPYRLSRALHILTIRFYRLDESTDHPYRGNVSYQDKVNKAIRESRDTLNRLFPSKDELVLKKDLRSAAIGQALSWLSILVPVIAILVPFSIPVFWRLGQEWSSTRPELMELVPWLTVIVFGPLFLVGYVWIWVWIIRTVLKRR